MRYCALQRARESPGNSYDFDDQALFCRMEMMLKLMFMSAFLFLHWNQGVDGGHCGNCVFLVEEFRSDNYVHKNKY